jgi:hypothetical protein
MEGGVHAKGEEGRSTYGGWGAYTRDGTQWKSVQRRVGFRTKKGWHTSCGLVCAPPGFICAICGLLCTLHVSICILSKVWVALLDLCVPLLDTILANATRKTSLLQYLA